MNKNTQSYLERAVVQIEGTALQTLTEKDGTFRISGVPAGTYTLIARYTGLDVGTQSVVVTDEQTATVDFGLTSEEVYLLDQFVVTGAIEGTANAINQQRHAATARSVSTMDAFVDQSTGNPGEFLRNISGIQMDYSQNEPNRIRLRGQDSTLTSVTMDGNEIAGAASSGTSRSLEIDQLSMAAIESVEVYKAPIPSMSANAIGGAVNFTTKSAFDQAGRRISLQFGLVTDSHDFFNKYDGPGHNDTGRQLSLYPVGRLTYSNSFFNNRLGIVASVGRDETNMLGSSTTHGFNVYNGPAAPEPFTPGNSTIRRSGLSFNPNRQLRTRTDYSLNTDFRASEAITLFLRTTLTRYHSTNRNHSFGLSLPNSLALYAPGSTLESYTTSSGFATQGVNVFEKYTESWQVNPGVKFKSGNWRAELVGAYSRSENHYENHDTFNSLNIATGTINTAGSATSGVPVGFTIDTPLDDEVPTRIVQNSGPDFYNLNSYIPNQGNLAATGQHRTDHAGMVSNNVRRGSEDRISARFDVQRDFEFRFPFYLKGGVSFNETDREKRQPQRRWYWMGDDGIAGTADDTTAAGAQLGRFAEPNPVTQGIPGFTLREPTYLNTVRLWEYWQAHPQVLQENLAYAKEQQIVGYRRIDEDIVGFYLMGNATFDKLNVLAGVRVEDTDITATGVRTLPTTGPNSVLPAGVHANSLAGVIAKYRLHTTRSGYRSDPFPYLHVRYEITPDLQVRASYTESIGRPDFGQILPSLTQDDTPVQGYAGTITSTLTGLLPQRSQNFDFGIEYYTKTAGEWSVSWFRRDIDDYISSATIGMTSELLEELNLDSAFSNYRLVTSANLGNAKWDGYEISMRQRLSDWVFLPGFLKGFEVWANHTRLYTMEGTFTGGTTGATITHLANVVDSQYNAGVSYRSPRGRFYIHLKTNFQAGRPTADILTTGPANQRNPRLEDYQFWDGEMSYQLRPQLRLTVTARNLGSERQKNTEMGLVRNKQQATGTSWIFGIKYDL